MDEILLPPAESAARVKLGEWAELLASPQAVTLTEQALLPDFLTDIFYSLLGYTGPGAPGGRYTLSREKHVEVDGQFVDAVLGDFRPARERFVVAVEGKGPRDPLERPFGGRSMSAVDQGYRYAINLRCEWIVVTNLREIRLYAKAADQRTYELFETTRLASDEVHLRRFVYLLGAERVVPEEGPCHLDELLAATEKADLELTRSFYDDYAAIRRDVLGRLREENPKILPETVLYYTQKLLDRVLFCAFSEDRGLLPENTLKNAFEHRDPYNPRPVWENFKGLFRSVDEGSEPLKIPGYNGGLFAPDWGLEHLVVPDDVCHYFKLLGDYDYRSPAQIGEDGDGGRLVDVDILGHIFERSITELEQIHVELAAGELDVPSDLLSRRHHEGAFYTPAFVTRYIVGQALTGVLEERFERLRRSRHQESRGAAKQALADPQIYDLDSLPGPGRRALVAFWEAWLKNLESLRLLDPACGSGAFLIEAFDQLHAVYQAAADRLEELRGQRSLFDPDRTILRNNLYGVDLNQEAIEICRLSIWIKTAQRGKPLTDLNHTVRVGNSLVEDEEVDHRALDWGAAFPEVFEDGGFDVVVGNPPYVRQELLGQLKEYLSANYASYHGMADLYVYFYERGLSLLKPGGRLSFIVTNKWIKAGYGKALRRHFHDAAWMESVVDLGHAKQVFEDADVFPSIVVMKKPVSEEPVPAATRVCAIPRDQLRIEDLGRQIEEEGFDLPRADLSSEPWMLEPPEVGRLMEKIRERGVPLAEYAGVKPYYGIKTGLNEAFLIDTPTKDRLVANDPRCGELLRPYLRGQDVQRWTPSWSGLWLILLKSSRDQPWPWSDEISRAESLFEDTYPSLYTHMKPLERKLRKRTDQGSYWWELRSCSYYEMFDQPKIFYQEIQFHAAYGIDKQGHFGNNKTFLLRTEDPYLLAVLNSPLMWWHNWRYLVHLKDEALSPARFKMNKLPIAPPPEEIWEIAQAGVARLIEIGHQQQLVLATLLDWLRVEHEIAKPSKKLRNPYLLSSDDFVAEVRKARGRKHPLSAAGLKSVREEYSASISPMTGSLSEMFDWEQRLAKAVNSAYGLTSRETELLWQTAPPRMPTKK